MKLSEEVREAIIESCQEAGQSMEFTNMVLSLIQNKINDNYSESDLKNLIDKVIS